jgi:C4-type Zn-finger protein
MKKDYRNENPVCGTDSTDHFMFFCPVCDKAIKIKSVDRLTKKNWGMEVIAFNFECVKCNYKGYRKIYLDYPHDGNGIIEHFCRKNKTKLF